MATLESLGYRSISEMSHDEAISLIMQIRLSRRTQKKEPKPVTKTTSKSVARKATRHLDKKSILELLNMIED